MGSQEHFLDTSYSKVYILTGKSRFSRGFVMIYTKLLNEDNVIVELRGKSFEDAIREIISYIEETGKIKDPEKLYNDIIEREKISPTILENNAVMPHACTKAVSEKVVAFARSRAGIPIVDGKYGKFFFFVAVPPHERKKLFDMMSEINYLVKDKELLGEILAARNIDDILYAFHEKRMPLLLELRRKLVRLQKAFA